MKVLVYGWYHQGNLGDDLFIEAYHHLFPDYEFIFSEYINLENLTGIDAVFFGGGSFLLDRPLIDDCALEELQSKKIFYIGIGVEKKIHPLHLKLLSQAKMIATRSPDQIDNLKNINKNVIFIPDLVYALQKKIKCNSKNKSVLILPNVSVVPQRNEPYWKHAAWSYFKSEFTQFLDWLIDNGYQPSFFSMCRGLEVQDNWAAAELISHMEKRNNNYLIQELFFSFEELSNLFSNYDMIITQRFHGIVLSEMTRTPYIGIHHHDKLEFCSPKEGKFISYYEINKKKLIELFNSNLSMKFNNPLPVEPAIFETFTKEVNNII